MIMKHLTIDLVSQGWMVAVGLFALFCVIELVAAPTRETGSFSFRRMMTNFSMPVIAAALAAIAPFSATAAALWADKAGIGLFNHLTMPAPIVFVVAVVTRTLVAYWLHRAFHRWPILWRIHRVHHADRFIDVTLALRHHPFESLLAIGVYALTAALLGLPAWIAISVDLLMLAAGYWEHLDLAAPRWFSSGLRLILTTPDWHRVHHSALRRETDSNYGSLLSIWDRWFLTDRPVASGPVRRIGLGEQEDIRADDVWAQLKSPFRR